mmetsp:Transcript_147428/g.257710  ORF Transcript_147428/g.257710 Transcript_147428/m.257710 type:complete len:243 (-) Transcript_147428:2094-2822(-)
MCGGGGPEGAPPTLANMVPPVRGLDPDHRRLLLQVLPRALPPEGVLLADAVPTEGALDPHGRGRLLLFQLLWEPPLLLPRLGHLPPHPVAAIRRLDPDRRFVFHQDPLPPRRRSGWVPYPAVPPEGLLNGDDVPLRLPCLVVAMAELDLVVLPLVPHLQLPPAGLREGHGTASGRRQVQAWRGLGGRPRSTLGRRQRWFRPSRWEQRCAHWRSAVLLVRVLCVPLPQTMHQLPVLLDGGRGP